MVLYVCGYKVFFVFKMFWDNFSILLVVVWFMENKYYFVFVVLCKKLLDLRVKLLLWGLIFIGFYDESRKNNESFFVCIGF